MPETRRKTFSGLVDHYRQTVGSSFRAEIDLLIGEKKKEGLCPYEGRWRNMEEILSLQASLRRRDRTISFELFLLLIGMAVLNILMAMILFSV